MVNEAVATGLKVAPITGDIWDLYSGGTKLFNPELTWQQRALGAGQMGLGMAGLATLGAGSLAKSGVKGLAKYSSKYGSKKFMTKAAQKQAIKAGANPFITSVKAGVGNIPYNTAVMANDLNKGIMRGAEGFGNSLIGRIGGLVNAHPFLSIAGLEGANFLLSDNDGTNKKRDVTEGDDDGSNASNGSTGGNGGYNGSYGGSINLGSNGSVGLTQEQLNDAFKQISQNGYNDGGYGYGDEGRALVHDYMYNQQMMEPYRRNLQNYIRDYDTRADWAYNQDKRLALLAALTGATGLNQMIGKNNALVNEANRLGLMKTAGEDLKSVGEGMNTLVGNMALAKMTGLPLSAANADTKMAQLAVNKMIADDRNENRLDVAQYNGALKLQMAQERARLQMYLRSGNRRAATDSYKRLRALTQAAGLVDKGVDVGVINSFTGLNVPLQQYQSTSAPGTVKLHR